jgi:hypothetical protein
MQVTHNNNIALEPKCALHIKRHARVRQASHVAIQCHYLYFNSAEAQSQSDDLLEAWTSNLLSPRSWTIVFMCR